MLPLTQKVFKTELSQTVKTTSNLPFVEVTTSIVLSLENFYELTYVDISVLIKTGTPCTHTQIHFNTLLSSLASFHACHS